MRPLGCVAILAVLAIGVLGTPGLAAAHETTAVNGYAILFGGADEPVITGERMWLEVRITDSETEEPVTDLEDDLTMAVQRPFGNDTFELEVSSKFGQPGWYEAAVIFTKPGTYTVYLSGSIDGTAFETSFQKQVRNASKLKYPQPTPDSESGVTMDASMGFGIGVVVAAVGMIGAFVLGRRW